MAIAALCRPLRPYIAGGSLEAKPVAEPLLSGQAPPGREGRPEAAARAKGPHDSPRGAGPYRQPRSHHEAPRILPIQRIIFS
ncbi:hypothetical protein ACSSVV_001542 [Marinobacter sp. MBR-105]|jgi:hypothetical protein